MSRHDPDKESAQQMQAESQGDAGRESKEHSRDLFDNSMVGLYRTAPDGRILLANPAIVHMLGYSSFEELVQRNLEEGEYEPQYLRSAFKQRIDSEGQVVGLESAWTRRDGTTLFVRESARAVCDEAGNTLYYEGTVEDITERKLAEERLKASEERYRRLVEQSPETIAVHSEGKLVYVNPAGQRLFGASSLEDVIGKPIMDFIHPDYREVVEERVRGSYEQGHPAGALAERMIRLDGQIIDVEVSSEPITYEHKPATQVVIRDVTERRQAEEELQSHHEQVEKMVDERTAELAKANEQLQREMAERVQAEESLRQSEERYRTIVETTPSLLVICDAKGNNTYVSPNCEQITGYTQEELLGKVIWWVHEDDTPRAKELYDRTFRDGLGERGFEYKAAKKNGELWYASSSWEPLTDEEGNFKGVVFQTTDITARKGGEEALRQSEERYRTLFQQSRDAILVIAGGGETIDYNQAALDLFGYTPEDMATIDARERYVDPADRRRHHQEIDEKGYVEDLELKLRKKDGTEIDCLITASSSSDADGNILYWGTFRDITQRKREEERLRKLSRAVEQSSSTVVITDIQGNIEYANPRFTELTGYTVDEALGKNPRFLKSGQHSPQFYGELWGLILAGGDWRGEFVNRKKDGELYWELASISPIRDASGKISHFVKVAEDITQRKRAEQELREARGEEQERRQEADRRRAIAESFADVVAALNSNQSLDEVLDLIATQAGQLLGNQAVGIYSLEGEDGRLTVRASRGLLISYAAGADIPIGQEALREAMASRRPVAIPDLAAATSKDAHPARNAQTGPAQDEASVASWADAYRALLAVPIIALDEIYGGILLYYAQPRALSDDEMELAVAFGDQITLAVENARLRDQVRAAAAIAERERLARDLHDAVTQTLFSATLIAETLPRLWERDPAAVQEGLEELRQLTQGALAEMRTLLLELRPAALTEKPLAEIFRHLIRAVTSRIRVPIALTVEGDSSLPPDLQIALYRIAQESLNNIAKHAAASQATVDLRCQPGQVELHIADDGRGFDPSDVRPDQLGVNIMRERADSIGAELTIETRPGHGTQVAVIWPDPNGRQPDD